MSVFSVSQQDNSDSGSGLHSAARAATCSGRDSVRMPHGPVRLVRLADALARTLSSLRPTCMAAAVLICCLQISFDVSLGQDQVTIRVSRPDTGAPPVPSSDDRANAAEEQVAQVASEVSSDSEWQALPQDDLQAVEGQDEVELSVEPGFKPLLPADRPAWVGADPDYTGKIHRLYVGSTVVSKRSEADAALDLPLIAAVNNYIDDKVLNQVDGSQSLGIDESFIRRNLINDPAGVVLELNTSGAPMYQKWVTLEITPEQRAQFEQWYLETVQRGRIAPLGVGLGVLLGLVGLAHIVLRRKHGLPTSQPLAGEQLVANEAAEIAARRGHSMLATALLLFCGLAVAAFLLVGFSLASYRAVSHERRSDETAWPVESKPLRPPQAVPPPPVVQPPAVVPQEVIRVDSYAPTSTESEFEQEFVIESEQEVIQRVRRDR